MTGCGPANPLNTAVLWCSQQRFTTSGTAQEYLSVAGSVWRSLIIQHSETRATSSAARGGGLIVILQKAVILLRELARDGRDYYYIIL